MSRVGIQCSAEPNISGAGASGNIPDMPVLLVVPVSLSHQQVQELYRYLQPGTLDVYVYINGHSSRVSWWRDIWTKSVLGLNSIRKVIVASQTVSSTYLLTLHASYSAIVTSTGCALRL